MRRSESVAGEHREGDGGAEGNRTPDLVIANDALYQLSYDPNEAAYAPVAEGGQAGPGRGNAGRIEGAPGGIPVPTEGRFDAMGGSASVVPRRGIEPLFPG